MNEKEIDLWAINKLCDILERVKDNKIKPHHLDMVLALLETVEHFQSSFTPVFDSKAMDKHWYNIKDSKLPPSRVRYAIKHFDSPYICKEILNILRHYELCD